MTRVRKPTGPELEGLRRSVPELVGWIHEASNPYANWYFGDAALAREILDEWTGRETSEVHLGRARFMDDGEAGVPAGCLIALAGAELARCRAADFAAFCADLGGGPDAEAVIEQVVSASRALFAPVPEDVLYISRVAVAPRARGRGIGRALVRAVMDEARETGVRRFRLDVSADNAAAIRAYEAAGFAVAETRRSEAAGLTYCAMAAGD